MTLLDDLVAYVRTTNITQWKVRNGSKVPETDDLTLTNDAVKLEGTVLYADLADSTELVNNYPAMFAAEVYKNYLYTAARLIRNRGGAVTAYDGDRVMGVFIGDNKNSNAARCGLEINYAVTKMALRI